MRSARTIAVTAALLILAGLTLAASPSSSRPGQRMELIYEPLEAILKDLQAYDTSDVGPSVRLRAHIFSVKDNPQARRETEAALLKFIQGPPSPPPAGLMAACRALSLIAGPGSVPVFAALALKPETTDAARYTLERIPGIEADQALTAALDKAAGEVRRGVVFSLGIRKTAAAVPALARLAGGKDAVLAADAVKALGRIGGTEAVKALTAALVRSAALRSEAASALLLAAEGLLENGDKAGAAAVYEKVFAANVSPISRQAAFKGRIAASPDPKGLILKALTGKDTLLYEPALALVAANFGPDEIGKVADLSDGLPVGCRTQFAALLAGYPAEAVTSILLAAAADLSPVVRRAAYHSIAAAGDGRSVPFLAIAASRLTGEEQDAAREALARLKGRDVDDKVLDFLGKPSDAVKSELIRAAGARRISGAKPALLEFVKTGPPALKTRAAAALRTICGQGDLPGLIDLLGELDDETAREAMQDTIAAAARTNPRELARSGEVRARLAAEKDPRKRADLLRILGKIGDDSALALVRAALGQPDASVRDAAVRALAEWPTVSARDDVLAIARTSLELSHRVLAIRAYVRLVGLEPNRAPEGAAADLLNILALSPRPEEKKLVLGMLARFPGVTSLKTAESLQADPAVADEARIAADRIRRALK